MVQVQCKQCGADYYEKPCRVERTSCCSRACLTLWKTGKRCSPDTEFKQGHDGNLTMILGSTTIRNPKKKDKSRRFIKTRYGWMPYANWLWIAMHGELKRGDVVHHLDGDALNDSKDNLLALPRAVHPTLHSKWGLKPPPPEMLTWLRERYA